MKLNRRHFVGLGVGLLGVGLPKNGDTANAQTEVEEEVSDELARSILTEESEPGTYERAVVNDYWFDKPIGERPNPRWPQDNVSFDYAHLTSQPNSTESFVITPAIIATLLDLNFIQRDVKRPRLLFGLRGCMLAPEAGKKNAVVSTRPDHVKPRCVMGVWNTETDTVDLFSASTVPGVDLMEKHIQGRLRCNMLPTGLHGYQVGPHRGPRQPGAFIQKTPVWVHRSTKDLIYVLDQPGTQWDDLDGELPFDDLHAAMLSSRKTAPFFSSAGCQVVVGAYSGKVPTGSWADFRKAAGLKHPPQMRDESHTSDDGIEFDYVLLTGKDAQLAASGTEDALKTARALRFGSSGPLVEDLQTKLSATKQGTGIEKTGIIDRKTLGAIIAWQTANKLAQTGIIAQDHAEKLGISFPPLKLAKR
jgi:endonuclease G